MPKRLLCPLVAALLLVAVPAGAAEALDQDGGLLTLLGIPIEFLLFGAVLLGVAVFHHHTFNVALVGVTVIVLYKLGFIGFDGVSGLSGLGAHLAHEWVILINL